MNLQSVNEWAHRLGLLPVPLAEGEQLANPYVLLNGARGNFCLDTTPGPTEVDPRSLAWSANLGHYISVEEKQLAVFRWDRAPQHLERFTTASVAEKVDEFYAYLERSHPESSRSVVSHVMRVFRVLRAEARDLGGNEALGAFLYLLASAINKSSSLTKAEQERWKLSPVAASAANTISQDKWSDLIQLIQGSNHSSLSLDPTLLIRHASGLLFQEAHWEAVVSSQSELFLPAPISPKQPTQSQGVHFTPPALARALVEHAIAAAETIPSPLRVLDPACGSGEFLREAFRQLRLQGFSGRVELIGYDISPAACAMADFALAAETRRDTDSTVTVKCGNALEFEWPDRVNLLLMNPPFLSWGDMSGDQREQIREELGSFAAGRIDLSTAFVLKACESLAPEGVIGTIVPASFLDSHAAKKVREQIGSHLSLELVARLGSQNLFHAATIDAGLLVARRGPQRNTPIAFWSDHLPSSSAAGLRALRRARHEPMALVSPIEGEGFSIFKNPELSIKRSSWAPRPYDRWRLLNTLREFPTVRDTFDVKQGIRTALREAYVVSAKQYEELPKGERSYFRPAVLNDSVRDGMLLASSFIFYPYGDYSIESEEHLKEVVPEFYNNSLRQNRAHLMRSRTRWWELTRHRTWQVSPAPKIVSTYFGDAGSFAWDETGDYAVVQGYGWLPWQKADPDKWSRTIWLAYVALLNSPMMSALLGAVSNNVGGGQWNLSTRFVDQIPLPQLHKGQHSPDLLDTLAYCGEAIHTGDVVLQSSEMLLEASCAIYGVGPTDVRKHART